MKSSFLKTDANEWTVETELGDYTLIYDAETDEYTLYFLPFYAGSIAKHIASSVDRVWLEDEAYGHYEGLKGGDNAIR
jgi:hypothetical protein